MMTSAADPRCDDDSQLRHGVFIIPLGITRFTLMCCVLLMSVMLFGDSSVRAADDGDQALLKKLGRPDAVIVPLWPAGDGPGEVSGRFQDDVLKRDDDKLVFRPVVKAELIIVPPPVGARSNGVTFLFCPGGGYGALETESFQQGVNWCHQLGATAVLLKYRIPRRDPKQPAHYLPLMDAQRALGLLRSRATEWKLDAQKIGVIGFSAGGNLAALLSNHHAKRGYEAVDAHDQASCRPDFCVLMYPAYLTDPILELSPSPALEQDLMTPEKTPPTFIAVVRPDKFAVGCVSYLKALRKAKVAAELHVFSSGGHGGCFDRYPLSGWAYEAVRFLRGHQLLDDEAVAANDAWLRTVEVTIKDKVEGPLVDTVGAAKQRPQVDSSKVIEKPQDALPDAELSLADRELKKLVANDSSIIPVWPRGKRPADPLADKLTEATPTLSSETEFLRIGNVSEPTLTVMKPQRPDGRAILVCPGGGYSRLAAEHEGTAIGKWLNQQGITVFLLKYRVPSRNGVPVALQDAQRSLSLIRSRAAEFGIDPEWIGIMGFSAGGHLAAVCCHKYRDRSYEPIDAHDRVLLRPNFALLIYPAYLAINGGQLVEPFLQPQRNWTPPTFVAFAINDNLIEGAFPYVLKLREARVPVAFHVYETGGHGKGLRPDGQAFRRWSFAAERWLSDLLSVPIAEN